MAHSTFKALASKLVFEDDDYKFWWKSTAQPLARLLEFCHYSEADQHKILEWYHRFILPALGPRPIAGQKAQFAPCLVFDGSSCELSMNWKERDTRRTARFTIEAVGSQAGTAADPFNQVEARALLQRMAKEVPSIDFSLYDAFAEVMFIRSEALASMTSKLAGDIPLSQVWLAFDLLGGEILAKAYFIPILAWMYTGTPTKTLVRTALSKCPTIYGSYDYAYRILESYLDEVPAGKAPHIELIGLDCIDSPNARVKLYLRTKANTLAKAKEAYTLGGRLSGEVVDAGLAALTDFWAAIFRLGSVNMDHIQVLDDDQGCGYAIEMKPGTAEPEIKLHCPVRKIQGNDEQITSSLVDYFEKHGDTELATSYKEETNRIFPDHNLTSGRGTHTFVSFAYSDKTGVYMSVYYSTKIFGVHVKEIPAGANFAWNQAEGGSGTS